MASVCPSKDAGVCRRDLGSLADSNHPCIHDTLCACARTRSGSPSTCRGRNAALPQVGLSARGGAHRPAGFYFKCRAARMAVACCRYPIAGTSPGGLTAAVTSRTGGLSSPGSVHYGMKVATCIRIARVFEESWPESPRFRQICSRTHRRGLLLFAWFAGRANPNLEYCPSIFNLPGSSFEPVGRQGDRGSGTWRCSWFTHLPCRALAAPCLAFSQQLLQLDLRPERCPSPPFFLCVWHAAKGLVVPGYCVAIQTAHYVRQACTLSV